MRPIIQSDRDEAANWLDTYGYAHVLAESELIRHGYRDGHTLVQAFARHRLAVDDLTCIVRRPASVWRGWAAHTVICSQSIVEGYLRTGYEFDWPATDEARAKATTPSGGEGLGETARHFHDGMFYYRGLLDQIAAHLGPEAWRADNGDEMGGVVRARLPELVAARLATTPSPDAPTT